jgi:hypothetical protein
MRLSERLLFLVLVGFCMEEFGNGGTVEFVGVSAVFLFFKERVKRLLSEESV